MPINYGGLAQGLQSGVNLALSLQQAKQQREQMEWQKDWQMGSLASEVWSNKNNPVAVRREAYNNGFAPVVSKYTGRQVKPLTDEDFNDDAFKQYQKEVNSIISDKKMDNSTKQDFVLKAGLDYEAKRGNAENFRKLAMEITTPKNIEKPETEADIKAGILNKYLNKQPLTPEENEVLKKKIFSSNMWDSLFKYLGETNR